MSSVTLRSLTLGGTAQGYRCGSLPTACWTDRTEHHPPPHLASCSHTSPLPSASLGRGNTEKRLEEASAFQLRASNRQTSPAAHVAEQAVKPLKSQLCRSSAWNKGAPWSRTAVALAHGPWLQGLSSWGLSPPHSSSGRSTSVLVKVSST